MMKRLSAGNKFARRRLRRMARPPLGAARRLWTRPARLACLVVATAAAEPSADATAAAEAFVQSLLDRAEPETSDVDARDHNGVTALMHAAGLGSVVAVELTAVMLKTPPVTSKCRERFWASRVAPSP